MAEQCRRPAAALLCLAGLLVAAAQTAAQDDLCFNQLQVLGTHNSYHQAPPPQLLQAFGPIGSGPLSAWQYSHPSITDQLDAGVRALELDVFWDPEGGRFGQAAGLKIAGQNGFLDDPRYRQPGFKVLHIPDFDYRSSCVLLSECLAEIKAWSDANPRHLPLRVYVEVKRAEQVQDSLGPILFSLVQNLLNQSTAPGPTSFVTAPETTVKTFQDLQAEFVAAFGGGTGARGQLLTPDDVRAALGAQQGADLRSLLLQAPGSGPCRWPSLESMRGKVLPILIMYGGSSQVALMEEAYPSLVGSVAWLEQAGRTDLGNAVFRGTAIGRLDTGASLSRDLPADAAEQVLELAGFVRNATAFGFVVRSRTDVDTIEARAGFTGRRDAIIAAGAQVVATDFLLPANQQRSESTAAPLFNTTYNVTLPGGRQARCVQDFADSTGGGAGDAAVQLAMATADDGGDSIYCGPLVSAPPGREAFPAAQPPGGAAPQPSPAAEGAADGGGGGSDVADATTPPPPAAGPTSAGSLQASCRLPAALWAAAGALLAAVALAV